MMLGGLLNRLRRPAAPVSPRSAPDVATPPEAWTPPPAHPVTLALEDAARRRDRDAMPVLLDAVLAQPGLGEFEQLAAAVTLKVNGFPQGGEQLLLHLLARAPEYHFAHFELGAVRRWLGRPFDSMLAYRRAVELAPETFNYRFALAEMLHGLGRHDEASAHLRRLHPETDDQKQRIELLRAFADYLRAYPKVYAQHALVEIRRRYDWIGHHEVAERIEAAVTARTPFALIRLGDGEGAFARIGEADEARFARLYGWMREDWVRFLFGPEFDAEATGYAELTRDLMATVGEADILGAPYPSWVEHEYNHVSARGVPCVLNIHRNLLAHPPAVRPRLCDQLVHIQLHNDGLIEPILRRAGRLTVISCLTGLGDLIRARFGLEEVEMIPVPREYSAPHLRADDHVEGEAFPAAYDQVLRRLSQPHEGRVFIVAAGTLGKFYAAAIKRHGGIALDLGSLVDGWMRLPSRADYGENLAL